MTHGSKIQYRYRRIIAVLIAAAGAVALVVTHPSSYEPIYISAEGAIQNQATNSNTETPTDPASSSTPSIKTAQSILATIEIKGRAPKTGYTREQFYKTWPTIEGCSLRQRIIKREMGSSATLADDNCTVLTGEFDEPYTGQHLIFYQKSDFSRGIQIDHVVALSDAWQKGAQNLDADTRYALATDPLNLLAVDAATNQKKSDGDAATWLPPNKSFRCQYVARQVSVKAKYTLWMTQAEHDAISRVLETCPGEPAVGLL